MVLGTLAAGVCFNSVCSCLLSYFQASFQRDRDTGVTTVKYNIEKRTNLDVNGAPCVILNVNLHCNAEKTPWCDNPES